MTTTVASANLKYTLTGAEFEKGLREVLRDRPHILALQEAGPNRNPIIERVAADFGYTWDRPTQGGEPVLWKNTRYRLRAVHAVTLAKPEYVGHLPGRKSKLPASIATEVTLDDLETGDITVVLVFHLTAEVQDMKAGGKYKRDLEHRLRVQRHRREKHRLGKRARTQLRRGRTVYVVGDSNFDGFTLGRFVSCWDHRSGGTLGPRAVDVILAKDRGLKLWTVETPSDHDALVVTYK